MKYYLAKKTQQTTDTDYTEKTFKKFILIARSSYAGNGVHHWTTIYFWDMAMLYCDTGLESQESQMILFHVTHFQIQKFSSISD